MRWIASLLLVLLPVLCEAQPARMSRRAALMASRPAVAGGGGGADTQKEVVYAAPNSSQTYGGLGPDDWLASSFTASNTYTLHRVDVVLYKTGSPTWTMKAYIYADLTNSPFGGLLGTPSGNVSASTVTGTDNASASTNSFTGLSVSMVSGTKYWVVLGSTGSPHDFANYINWLKYGGTGGASDIIYKSSDGSSWSMADNFEKCPLITYGQ